ncbi:Hsp70 family protein [Actinomycetospora endophytica]|uniref:Hsp70 family protein n=1 Tax=Actinomycetospora endophytica TaxID=2291215 RepID=A0ABS8PDM2_9PSEU|nr:Hsp70 family protein [Actinomycetospora endophytica]MCD2196366.1 Hsp70 family protein [Actinomycetospora endophytica]
MGYDLGVDLGGTTVVAAVLREGARQAEAVPLGFDGAAALPATAHRGSDGAVRTGEEAERRAAAEPDRVVRDVTSRLGDEVPHVVGGEPWRPDDVAAEIVLAAVRRVAAQEGGAARALAVTHPAGWGPHRERTLRRALIRVGLGHATLISESRAAALGGARGPVAGVYDLGGRSFRAAVVRLGPAGRDVLADSGAPDRAGGIDIDAAVLALVREQLGGDLEAAIEGLPDDEARVGLGTLRTAAHDAKELLSADTEARIEVALGSLHTTVRITRSDLEGRITPLVAATVESFAGTVDAAGVPLDDVVLVGGSSRIPLVARLLAEELGRPVHPGVDPVTVVAEGAAVAAAEHAATRHREAMGPATGEFAAAGAGSVAAAGAAVMAGTAVGTCAAGARHRSPETTDAAGHPADAAAARAGAAATATGAWSTDLDDSADSAPGALGTGASGRSATAVLERTRPSTSEVPRPPVNTALPPIGPNAEPGPLRRYRSWIVAGFAVVVLGAGAATVPIPGLTAARTTETPTPAPTPVPPSATPTPAATPAPPPPSSAPPSTTAAGGSSSGSAASGSSGGGSSKGSSGSSESGSSESGSSATPRSTASRPTTTRRTSPAAFVPTTASPGSSAISGSSPNTATPASPASPDAPVSDPPSSATAAPAPGSVAPAVVEPSSVEPAMASAPTGSSTPGAGS